MRHLAISTKFQWIPSIFQHFPIFRYNSGTISNQEKSYNKRYLPLSYSKYNETSPKLVYSYETSGTVMHAIFQPISMQNAKVLNQDR